MKDNTEILPAGTKLRMLRDMILLRPMDWDASSIIIAIRHGRPVRGEIIAVGPGARMKRRWKNREGQVHKIGELDRLIPTEVKPGDIVELGGLSTFDGAGYMFQEVIIGTERLLMCQEADVAALVLS
jgi:co-chaperonin GroES (HSP10)